ncbi:DNA/RNA polymerase [Roridomyces roridus]|uniref:DNA-directed RNA polymerase n=1 Tax=Roridomyces roridus TaxID=1738132 RepID=A0AAD7BFM8_9AGAR|nr:DNA/RNA polymerase [Roridomyces roridus]
MLIARACRRAIRGRGGRILGPSTRAYAAAAVQVQVPRHRADGVKNFLAQPAQYALLPTPLPVDCSSDANDYWFSNTSTQELMAVVAACLHDLYDVPRAKGIFDRLRTTTSTAMETRIVNAMLGAYLNSASRNEPEYWMESLWELFDALQQPSAGTYAIVLLAIHRFPEHAAKSFNDILTAAVTHEVPLTNLVSDRAFSDDEEALQIIAELSKSAIQLNLPTALEALGEAQARGSEIEAEAAEFPAVNPVEKVSKDGSKEVPFNLKNLREHLARVALARRVLPTDVNARQKLLEDSVYDAAKARLVHQHQIFAEIGLDNQALLQPELQRWMWQWHLQLKERLESEIKNIAAAEVAQPVGKKNPVLAPYLALVKADKLSILTIVEIMRLQGSGGIAEGMKTARALIDVGKAVETEYKAQMCKSNRIDLPSASLPPRDWFSNMGYRSLNERRVAAARLMMDNEGWTAPWTQAVRSQVGAILVECLMDVAEVTRTAKHKITGELITEQQPAFYQSYEYLRGQKLGVIRLNPAVSQRLSKDPMPVHPRHLPMLVKPKPWINYNEGGYLYARSHVMRFKDSIEQRSYLKYASEQGHVELVYAGLDVLGSTPWQINKRIFDVVREVWNSGTRLGKMPPAVYDEPEPEIPKDHDTDLSQRNVYITRMRAYNQEKAANHSDRCSVNYKMEISRSFLHDTFYLPHNVDFRGRAYPIPPHLNHIGDDLSRGLLKFAEAKPLGERGFRWLKIHLSNLYGYDKANFDERVAFTDSHMDDIYDSVLHPLDGRGWWQKADDPWQCLAACQEVYSAIESGEPHAYECALPVHQDGTCNGLQHYAALGGDAHGAAQVNLSAGDRPSDVYTYVGNMVEQMLEADAEKGHKFALMLKGKISRKVVKQTVMTTVYGVTFIGARDQIEKQLRDRKDLPEEECWLAASYLAKKVLGAIGDLFSGAKHIQTWLNLCARLISKSIPEERIPEALSEHAEAQRRKRRRNASKKTASLPTVRLKKEQMTSVVWTTPLGLPICQPYRKNARKQVFTSMQTVYISDPGAPAEVNSLKQASAFPPNFIHSLDATHMMLTAIECRVQGLTFASVHDSYWTHACSIDQMSEIIRDTFIALHSSDVLKKLETEFRKRYEGFQVPLVNLRNGQLVKTLRTAGSRIYCTEEQAKGLSAIKDLLVISDTEQTTVETQKVYDNLDGLLEQLQEDGDFDAEESESEEKVKKPRKRRMTKKEKLEAEEAAAMASLVDELEGVSPAEEPELEDQDSLMEARAAKKKSDEAKDLAQLMGKFVKLTDLLPPLPEKGSFEVSKIKDSPYFFS